MGKYKTKIRRYLDGSYFVGIVENWNLENLDNYSSRIRWINTDGYNAGWFADPFIINVDQSTITLLVEEYLFETRKGRLSLIKVSRNDYTLFEVKPVLELSTHLSYPHPIVCDGMMYVCPENCAAKEVAIYEFDGNSLIEKVEILSKGYVDTQIFHLEDKFYAFTSETFPQLNGGSNILEIFVSDKLNGPYTYFQTINNHSIEERGAGIIFKYQDFIVRPTQDCNERYGSGVIFKALKLIDGRFVQSEIGRIKAKKQYKNGLCFHTFSVYDSMAAVDGFDYPIRFIGRLAPILYGIKSKLLKLIRAR